MNKTTFLAIMSIFILLMAISAQGQPISGQTYMDSQYAIEIYPPDQQLLSSQNPGLYQDQNSFESNAALQANIEYSSNVPSGAPTPFAPTSPDSLGLQIPTESAASYTQAPPSAETSQALIPASSASVEQMTKEVRVHSTIIRNPARRSQRGSEPGTSSTCPLFLRRLQAADFSAGSPCGCKPPA